MRRRIFPNKIAYQPIKSNYLSMTDMSSITVQRETENQSNDTARINVVKIDAYRQNLSDSPLSAT